MNKQLIAMASLLVISGATNAGALKDGVWAPGACGVRQEPPLIDAITADAYNASVKAINAWQLTTKAYDDCLVNEANADSAVIAKTATSEQGKIKDIINKINADLAAARHRLEQKPAAGR